MFEYDGADRIGAIKQVTRFCVVAAAVAGVALLVYWLFHVFITLGALFLRWLTS